MLFGVGFSELILILVIAYVFVGPEDLPKVARWLGRAVRKIRLLIRELRQDTGIDEVIEETRTLRRDIDSAVRDNTITRDLHEVHEELSGLGQDITRNIDEAKADTFRPSQTEERKS
ncbi:MAG: twin-arginine translocase TatA/TatE family subunit [Synergistaceae bacterium]|nr:twin-arginine translocase TatA/TatE family subunit [Synergistaceae bacterium]